MEKAEKIAILIIDDDPFVLAALEATLQHETRELYLVSSGEEALEILEKINPSLIISDQGLPGISGVEVLEKASLLKPDAYRLLLTGNHSSETAVRAINVGHVNQYLIKPWDDGELKKIIDRVFERDQLIAEKKHLEQLIAAQNKQLKAAHETLKKDVLLGAKIHKQLLVGSCPKQAKGVVCGAVSIPSKEIDGDFYDFYSPNDQTLDLVFGDVMGKGVAAALVGIAVKTHMQRFSMPLSHINVYDHDLGWKQHVLTPEDIITHTHKEVVSDLIDLEYFATILYGRLDLRYKTFTYIDCGAPKPIYYRASDQKVHFLQGDSFPLGFLEKASYSSCQIDYEEGDIFVFYSDGVTEASSGLEFFGTKRLAEIVKNNSHLDPDALAELIKQEVSAFTGKDKFDDDLSCVVIKIAAEQPVWAKEEVSTEFVSDVVQLPAVREFVKDFCKKAPGNSEKLSMEMELLADEAFCNIVKHGKPKNLSSIKITLELKQTGVLLTLQDQGIVFDPTKVAKANLCGSKDGGYGWHIIRQLSTSITYTSKSSDDGFNELSIFKRYYQGEKVMQIETKTEQGVLIISPEGRSLDATGAHDFKENVTSLVNTQSVQEVVIDLGKLEFVDSSGLGSFLSILRLLNGRGGNLKLAKMSSSIRMMFELVKMHKIFEIFDTTEDAVKSFKSEV